MLIKNNCGHLFKKWKLLIKSLKIRNAKSLSFVSEVELMERLFLGMSSLIYCTLIFFKFNF